MDVDAVKTTADELDGGPALHILASIAPFVTGLLVVFLALSLCVNLVYYLGDGWRDTITEHHPVLPVGSPNRPTGLFVSAPTILHNESTTYDLILANNPISMTTATLVVRPIWVEHATLLPVETSVLTFTHDSYSAANLKLRSEPDRLFGWPWGLPAADSARITLQAVATPSQTLTLTLELDREPPFWGLLRQTFVLDSFDTAAVGIGVLLIVLQRITATRRKLQIDKAEEQLKVLLEEYRSGQLRLEFSKLREKVARYGKVYRSVLSGPRADALKNLESREPEIHRQVILNTLASRRGDAQSVTVGRSTRSPGADLFLDEHVAWFLYYYADSEQARQAKRDVLEKLDLSRDLIGDEHLRRDLIRQARLYASRGPLPGEPAGTSDPEFPQITDQQIKYLTGISEDPAGDSSGVRLLLIVGEPGSGKTTALTYIKGRLQEEYANKDGYTVYIDLDAEGIQTTARLMRRFANTLLQRLRDQLLLRPDVIDDLLTEREQERLLGFMREQEQSHDKPSPDDQRAVTQAGRVLERLAYMRVVVLLDNTPSTFDVSQLALELKVALPEQLARGLRICCAYQQQPSTHGTQAPLMIKLEWTAEQLGHLLTTSYFNKGDGKRPDLEFRERLSYLVDREGAKVAESAILSSSQTPADLVVWLNLFEEYFVGALANPKEQDWERLFRAMEEARRKRGVSVGWKRADWEQAREQLA